MYLLYVSEIINARSYVSGWLEHLCLIVFFFLGGGGKGLIVMFYLKEDKYNIKLRTSSF